MKMIKWILCEIMINKVYVLRKKMSKKVRISVLS